MSEPQFAISDVLHRQVTTLVEEAMQSIFVCIFGENRSSKVHFAWSRLMVNDLREVQAHAVAQSDGRNLRLMVDLPVRGPDTVAGYYLDDVPFAVDANIWGEKWQFTAWCGAYSPNGAITIVRGYLAGEMPMERWYVAESVENQVLFRGSFDDMALRFKRIVAEKWSHLPHVSIDTELRAMQGWDIVFRDAERTV